MKYFPSKPPMSSHTQSPGDDIYDHEQGRAKMTVDIEKASSTQTLPATAASTRTPSLQSMEPGFPEGGLAGWLVVVGSFCAMISVFGLINTAAVLESWFSTHQLELCNASQIGWIFSLYLFFVFFIGIQAGPAFDAYGPRYLVAIGSALMIASLLLLGFCTGRQSAIMQPLRSCVADC